MKIGVDGAQQQRFNGYRRCDRDHLPAISCWRDQTRLATKRASMAKTHTASACSVSIQLITAGVQSKVLIRMTETARRNFFTDAVKVRPGAHTSRGENGLTAKMSISAQTSDRPLHFGPSGTVSNAGWSANGAGQKPLISGKLSNHDVRNLLASYPAQQNLAKDLDGKPSCCNARPAYRIASSSLTRPFPLRRPLCPPAWRTR